MYNYRTNRTRALSTSDRRDEGSVAALLSNQASVLRVNEDFSLEAVITSLQVEQEQGLRSELILALSRGDCYAGSGNIISLQGEGVCYFCVVREEMPLIHEEMDSVDAVNNSYCASDFVVCFTKKASMGPRGDLESERYKAELEAFRPELDQYCAHLAYKGILEQCEEPTTPELVGESRAELKAWYARTVCYLPRCVQTLDKELHHVVKAAVLRRKVNVVAEHEPNFALDMDKLTELLSLDALFHRPDKSIRPQLGGLSKFIDPPTPVTVTIKTDGGLSLVDFEDPESLPESQFCQAWAKSMLSVDGNAIALKNIVLDHGRQVIEEVNTLKSLIGHAECNHYSLYEAYRYLEDSKSPVVALLQKVVDTIDPDSKDTIDVLRVLIKYRSSQK